MVVGIAVTRVAASQPLGDRPDVDPRLRAPVEVARPHSLVDAAREGASSLATARLDWLSDMATLDLAPLDDGTSVDAPDDEAPAEAAPVEAPAVGAPWPGGAPVVETSWTSCGFAGASQPVDLRAGALLPVQVSVASRGARAVALVAMGRPGADRHGMAFPEARWVEWNDGRVEVFPTRGFLPGAALALGDRDATVIAYTRPDPRTPEARASHTLDVDVATQVSVTRLDAHGRTLAGPNDLEGSDGWQIDSPVVLWQHGAAVVLGHPTQPPGDGGRRAVLHFLDARGHDARAPLELSVDARDGGYGVAPAGLTASPDGASLAAAWVVPDGPIAGVWVRRGITLDAQPFIPGTAHIVETNTPVWRRRGTPLYPRGMWTFRVGQGEGFWGPSVTRGGVFFGRSGTTLDGAGPITEVLFSPWPTDRRATPARALDALLDPLPTWTPGGPMIAGFASPAGATERALVVAYSPRGERALRTLTLPVDSAAPHPEDAADVAFAPLDSGALLAWIDDPSDRSARHLELARVTCQRASNAPATPPTPAATRPATPRHIMGAQNP
jgi:hypothetical protein